MTFGHAAVEVMYPQETPLRIANHRRALRFFFTVTLDRADTVKPLTFVAEPRKIPVVLSPEEVARFLEAAPGPKYKAAFGAAYGAGLRVSEVASLKVSDIDSKRMLLRVEQGKGRKDRHAMLSPQLLELLRDWYRIARPAVWLFPGGDPMLPMTTPRAPQPEHEGGDRGEGMAVDLSKIDCPARAAAWASLRSARPEWSATTACRGWRQAAHSSARRRPSGPRRGGAPVGAGPF